MSRKRDLSTAKLQNIHKLDNQNIVEKIIKKWKEDT